MAKFIFKMQNILDLKYKLEEQEKILYGNARIKLTEEENKLRVLKEQKIEYEEQYKYLLQTRLDLLKIQTVQHAIETIRKFIKQQKIAVIAAEKGLEAARIRLNLAMIERKTYETLRDKAFVEFKKEIDAIEQKEVDELVSYKFNNPECNEEEQ